MPNDGLRAVNVYVLETADGLVAVDGGWALPGAGALLARALATLGAGLGDLRRFLVTHVHRDHYTQAVAVRRETGARVGLGVGEQPSLEVLRSADRSPQSEQVAALRASGAAGLADRLEAAISDSKVDLAEWEPPDEWLTAGDYPLPGGRVLEAVETRVTPLVTWSSTTWRHGFCSPATTCCRRSRRRLASSQRWPSSRWPTSCAASRWYVRVRTRYCCRLTGPSLPACTRGSTS